MSNLKFSHIKRDVCRRLHILQKWSNWRCFLNYVSLLPVTLRRSVALQCGNYCTTLQLPLCFELQTPTTFTMRLMPNREAASHHVFQMFWTKNKHIYEVCNVCKSIIILYTAFIHLHTLNIDNVLLFLWLKTWSLRPRARFTVKSLTRLQQEKKLGPL